MLAINDTEITEKFCNIHIEHVTIIRMNSSFIFHLMQLFAREFRRKLDCDFTGK